MARIKVLLKSKNNPAPIYIRLSDGRDVDVMAKTIYSINPADWSPLKQEPKDLKDIANANLASDLFDLKNRLLKHYNKRSTNLLINTQWLKDFLNPDIEVIEETKLPNTLVEYIDFYIDYRKHEIKETSRKKFNVIKHKMERFQKKRKKPILISDINENFKQEFVEYYKAEGYAQNTMQRELVFIKTFCKHARHLGLETHPQLDNLRLDRAKVEKIFLSFEEIEKIENIEKEKLTESLENAKDWLIISCYTGQRVSDFLRFTKDMVRIENGKHLIEFTQQKTDKIMTIPLHKKVLEILEKRNGDFPYTISDQKYNDYIKKVCEIAKINNKIIGSKKVETAKDSGIYRKKTDTYKKHELVSSHIGRRSFATNFYGKIPTTYLIYVTGHSTEQMFLTYIGKSNKDLAMEIGNYF
uniref:tyrosine-type recombinase/integrase n=1 Tax=Flavobacterium sp. TaxID=239 RepID=UPI00404A0450